MRRVATVSFFSLVLALAACSGPGASMPTSVPTVPIATVSPTSVSPGTSTAVPTASVNAPGAAGVIAACGVRPIPPSTVASTQRMGPAQMVSATVGWATATGKLNDYSIMRTTDGGVHWQSVSPSGIWDHLAASSAFFGEENAWIILVLDDAPTPPSVARFVALATHDGGQSWQCGEPFVPGTGVRQLTFTDQQHGSLLIAPGAGTSGFYFGTDDSGIHWDRRSGVSG